MIHPKYILKYELKNNNGDFYLLYVLNINNIKTIFRVKSMQQLEYILSLYYPSIDLTL